MYAFFKSDLISYINGQEIYVDGGWLSKGLKMIKNELFNLSIQKFEATEL